MTDRCAIPKCRAEVEITYLDHGICAPHWNEFTAERLRMVLGIEADTPAKENEMFKKKTTPARKSQNDAALAATKAPAETTPANVAEPEADAPTVAHDAPVAAPVAEAPKKKKERAKKVSAPKPEAKEPLVVFAFRLTEAERDLIHETAGPRNATQFVRRVAAAFAGEDEAAFQTVIKEARAARQ